ncbi:uncharacterized protein LOC135945552 [Cloeon dipterum]|uniref:uncharacterized protein LOC135945552 n=1 Tax=Cloeon dipterum TaxID=197152 RepID=UPI00321F8034
MLRSMLVSSVKHSLEIRPWLPFQNSFTRTYIRRTDDDNNKGEGNEQRNQEIGNDGETPRVDYKGHFKRNVHWLKKHQSRPNSSNSNMKGNFMRNSNSAQRNTDDEDMDEKETRGTSPRDVLFKEDRKFFRRNFDSRESNTVDDDERDRLAFRDWIGMVAKYRASQRTPNFLTWETKERIKMLHASNPIEWTFDRLSANFPVSVVAVKQIVKNKWTPRSILEHDNAASKNWKAFKEGKIPVPDEILRAHLMSFLTRDEMKNLPQIEGFGEEQESDVPAEIRKESRVIDVHKEKLEQNVSTFNPTPDDMHTASYKLKIEIPKHKFKEGATYRIKDCYYHSDGIFLYRVPGMDQAP